MELEWVFFSVTPTSCNTSRIALLLTSSSLARSLIRTLLIRCASSEYPAKSSYQPHGVSLNALHVTLDARRKIAPPSKLQPQPLPPREHLARLRQPALPLDRHPEL